MPDYTRPYTLLIKPCSGDCNLRCHYCFYLRTLDLVYPETRRHRMDEETLRRVVTGYLGERFPVSGFCWQGGEPMLAGLDFYKKAVELQSKHGADGQVVSNSLQTNAILIDEEWARFLRQYSFLVGVSMDGPPELHDHYRRDAGGKPSHHRVLRAIEILRANQVEFNVLAVVNKLTVKHPREIYDYFRRMKISHLQFIPIVEIDADSRQVSDFVMAPEEYGEFLCALWDEWMRPGFPDLSIRDFESVIERLLGGGSSLCTFDSACNHYVMLEHNGDVFPCDFYCDPKYKLGNANETPLPEIFRSHKHAGFSWLKTCYPRECYQCRWLSLCNGGCTKDRMLGAPILGGENARGSNYFCRSYQMLFEHAYPRMLELRDRVWAMQTVPEPSEAAAPEPPSPPARVGRNDLCPCGSGLKYKNCCMPRK
ncbi:MAG: anaerobic sulfatase maturase [Candidatus Sumerlaeota bacterium]|nr:anaerobic sulfatase maturase [Candidatus Sumerlaeota bacterium]